MKLSRPSFSVVLCAALVGGLIPPGAARAAGGVLAAPALEAGVGVAAPGAGAAATFAAPAQINIGATLLPVAPLGGASALSAPAWAGAASVAPAAAAPALSAPAAEPSAVSPVAAGAAAVPFLSAPAAEPSAAPSAPAADAPRSWLSRAAGLFSRRAAPASAPASVDDAKVSSDRLFDGATAASAPDAAALAAPQGPLTRLNAGLRRFAARRVAAYQAKRAVAHDDFGGPKSDGPMTFGAKVAYGLKWGLNLVGLSALIDFTLAPLLARINWPTLLSTSTLDHLGRVELLIKYGPSTISAALTHAPLSFLGLAVPLSTASEELTYRFFGFGLTFALLAAAKPAAAFVATALDSVPDAAGLRSKVQRALLLIGRAAAYYAFPIAALSSSVRFAIAHFAHWGIDPTVFALNVVAGWVLARVAYKTRGLTAPFVAHLSFNFAMLGTAILGATFGLPLAASVYAVLASIVGVAALWYNWRAARKERALSLKNLAGAKNLVVAGLIASGLLGALGGGASHGSFSASRNAGLAEYLAAAPAPAASTVGGEAPAAAAPAAPAADAPAPFKTDADMVASVKPSVVEIIVKMSGGMAIGSGVIVSPTGLLVTNGHVVGDKAVGEIVEVKLSNDQVLPAKIMAVNHNRDIAILRLPNQRGGAAWPYSTFAKTAPREGDPLLAMGHPLGLPFTVTKGVLSGLGDRGNMFVQYLQTDASINHGNSGGPIYNTRGEVVGINTMIAGKEGSIGIGFSITAPNVVQALEQYAATGGIATAALGVIVDLSGPDQPDAGVAVEFVRAGSAAAKAGLLPGDLIVGVGEDKIAVGGEKAVHSLAAALAQAKPGDVLELSVLRGDADKPRVVQVKLDARATSEETSMAHGFDGGGEEP